MTLSNMLKLSLACRHCSLSRLLLRLQSQAPHSTLSAISSKDQLASGGSDTPSHGEDSLEQSRTPVKVTIGCIFRVRPLAIPSHTSCTARPCERAENGVALPPCRAVAYRATKRQRDNSCTQQLDRIAVPDALSGNLRLGGVPAQVEGQVESTTGTRGHCGTALEACSASLLTSPCQTRKRSCRQACFMTAAASQALAGVLQRRGSHAVGLVPIQASDEAWALHNPSVVDLRSCFCAPRGSCKTGDLGMQFVSTP